MPVEGKIHGDREGRQTCAQPVAEKTDIRRGERTRERQIMRRLRKSEDVVESYEEEFSLNMEPKGTLSIVEGQWQMKEERREGLDFRKKGRD